MKNSKVKNITHSAIIAALYVVLTIAAQFLGLASGSVQVRFSEALTILPVFTSAAIPGLAIGCLISNIISGGVIWDIIFGTFATLIGAVGTYMLRKHKWEASIPPIVSNTVIIPFVLIYAYGATEALPFLMLTVGIGEVISAGVLGTMLLKTLDKTNIFKQKMSQ